MARSPQTDRRVVRRLRGRRIRPRARFRVAAAAVLVLLPIGLALATAVPPILLAVPPMTLGVALWLVLRGLDREAGPGSGGGASKVIPIDAARSRARGPAAARPGRR